MDEDPQDYSDSSSCCQTELTRHLHPEEQNDLQLDSESDTSGIFFPAPKSKRNYIPVDVENDVDDIGDSSHRLRESSIDLERVIIPISSNGKPIRSPYLLRSRSSSPVASDEVSPIISQENKNFPKIDLGLKHIKWPQNSQKRILGKSSLPPLKEKDETILFKIARKSVEPCSSKSLGDDNKVVHRDRDQSDINEYSVDKIEQEDKKINEKALKNGPLVLNINFSLNCEKDKPLILNISPQYQGNNTNKDVKLQCNASTSIQNPIEDSDVTAEITSHNNEKGSQNDKMSSQTDDMGSQTDDIGSQTDAMTLPSNTVIKPEESLNKTAEQNKKIAPESSKKAKNIEKKGTQGKNKAKAKVVKKNNKPKTKKVNCKEKEKKKAGPKRPRVRHHQLQRIVNSNIQKRKYCRNYSSSSSSSEECCCSDSSTSSSCSCSSCCPSSCDCSVCD